MRSSDSRRVKATLEKDLQAIEEKESRLKRAIETYQEAFISVIRTNEKDLSLTCNDILVEQMLEDRENYDNFLRPEFIKHLKEDKVISLKNALFGKKKIWKPARFELPKHIRQLLHSQKPDDAHQDKKFTQS